MKGTCKKQKPDERRKQRKVIRGRKEKIQRYKTPFFAPHLQKIAGK
jgi:hypothetical protein